MFLHQSMLGSCILTLNSFLMEMNSRSWRELPVTVSGLSVTEYTRKPTLNQISKSKRLHGFIVRLRDDVRNDDVTKTRDNVTYIMHQGMELT